MSNELSKPTSAQVPAYLQDSDLGTEDLGKYVRPPRLKIIQAMSGEPFDKYEPGSVIVVPQLIEFAAFDRTTKVGTTFKFVPIFFYPEWLQCNPISLAGKEPFVRDRSIDPQSELAKKANNPDTWKEPHPDYEGEMLSNRELLNFVVMPVEHELEGTLCVMTFASAAYRDGTNLASMIKMRRGPICGQIFECSTSQRKNSKGQWYGFNIEIPAENPWVDEETFKVFSELHKGLKKDHESGLIQVDYEDAAESQVSQKYS